MRYLVTYTVTHIKEFDVPKADYIESVLSESNGCEILEIKEVPE